MGQAYEQAQKGINVSGFNAQVDVYNAWVREHFGEDPMMLMQKKLDAPLDLSKPVLVANNTTGGGIVHAIDGTGKAKGASYTTNDMNLLPDNVRYNTTTNSYAGYQGDFLGGV